MPGGAESSRGWGKPQNSRDALYKPGAVPHWKFPDIHRETAKELPPAAEDLPELTFSKREPGHVQLRQMRGGEIL